METNIEELVKQYEALWENDAPMEQIAEFCRQQLQLVEYERVNRPCLEIILHNSRKWGHNALTPIFLKHLQNDDKPLLRILLDFCGQGYFSLIPNAFSILLPHGFCHRKTFFQT